MYSDKQISPDLLELAPRDEIFHFPHRTDRRLVHWRDAGQGGFHQKVFCSAAYQGR